MTPPIEATPLEAEPFLRHHPQVTGRTHTGNAAVTCSTDCSSSAAQPQCTYPWSLDQLELPLAIAQQLQRLKAFAVLVIKIDVPAAAKVDEALNRALMQILNVEPNTRWGVYWKQNLYVCLLTQARIAEAGQQAAQIQEALAQSRPETLSIGITEFPLLDFSAAQCIANAGKATDHAAFLGHGSTIVFDAVSLNISGDHYYQAGDMKKAMLEYRSALQLDAANTNVLNSLGVCLARQGNLKDARKLFTSAWQKDDSEAMAIYNSAMVEILDGDPQKALPLLKQALARNETCFDIPFQIGKLLYKQKRHKRAVVYFEHAIALKDESATAHYYLGKCLAHIAQPKAAIASLSRAVKLNPNDAAALSALGNLYTVCEENPDICETFFQQSIALDPHNGVYHHRLGRFYQKHGHLEQALSAFENAKAMGYDGDKQLDQVRQALDTQIDKDARCA